MGHLASLSCQLSQRLPAFRLLPLVRAFKVQKYSVQEQQKFSKITRQSACSKTREIYLKNNIEISDCSETDVVTMCCRKSQVKIVEEQRKSDLSAPATWNMPLPS